MDVTSLLELEVHTVLCTRFIAVAALSATLYDYVLRLDEEIEFIWKQRLSFLKFLYLWQRYTGIFSVLIFTLGTGISVEVTMSLCGLWHFFLKWGSPIFVLGTEVAVFLWIWALYNHNRRLLPIFGLLLGVEFVTVCLLLGKSDGNYFVLHVVAFDGIPITSPTCDVSEVSRNIPYVWITVIVNACVAHAMVIYQRRRIWSPVLPNTTKYSRSIIKDLCIRSVLLIIPMNLLDVACAAIWIYTQPRAQSLVKEILLSRDLFVTLTLTVACNVVCSTRLLLDILCTYYERRKPSASFITTSTTTSGDNGDRSESSLSLRASQSFLDLSSAVIYADEIDRGVWAYELRQIKFSGFE